MTSKYSTFKLQLWELIWCSFIFLAGCIGNITVIVVSIKSKKISRTSPFNVYIFALAIIDLLISFFVLPDYILRTDIYELPGGKTGMLLCKFLIGGTLPFWLLGVSAYLLVVICLERRKAILQPFSTLQPQQLYKSVLVIFFVTLLACYNQIPTWSGIYYNKKNSTSGNFCAYNEDRVLALVFHFTSFIFQCLVPLFIFTISFYQIQCHLKQMNNNLKNMIFNKATEANNKGRDMLMKKKAVTIATMQMVVVVFFISIIPNEIVYLLFEFVSNTELEMNSPLFQVTVLLRYTNSCLNPLLYSYRSKEFRRHLKEVFQPWIKACTCYTQRIEPSERSPTISYSFLV